MGEKRGGFRHDVELGGELFAPVATDEFGDVGLEGVVVGHVALGENSTTMRAMVLPSPVKLVELGNEAELEIENGDAVVWRDEDAAHPRSAAPGYST